MFKKAGNFLLILLPITIINSQSANITIDELRVLKETFHNASVYMQKEARNENIAICIGPAKSGKSTLINYLMGNPLIAEQKRPGRPFTIKKADNSLGPAIGKGSTSETKIPSRWTSKHFPNMALWDSPGFSDNRGPQQDIANAFYLHQLLQKVKSLKIILVVDIKSIHDDNILSFMTVLVSLENLLHNKIKDCFKSISVIFSKVPTDYYGAVWNKALIKNKLKQNILDNENIDVSQDSRDFVRFLVENEKNIGILRKVEKEGNITSSIDVDIIPAILNSVPLKKYIVQELDLITSTSSSSYLQEAQGMLFSMKNIEDLQNIVGSTLDSKVLQYNSLNKKKMPQSEINEFKQELTSFENQLYKALNNCERLHEKIEILQGIVPTITDQLEKHSLYENIMLEQFIEKVLKWKENSLLGLILNTVVWTSILKIQNVFFITCSEVSENVKLQVSGVRIELSTIDINHCGPHVKYFEIFASNKVIIDTDIDFTGREMQVTIIAPFWKVQGGRQIILNGKDATEFKELEAKNGTTEGNKNGADGLAGLPGGSAGSFHGVTFEIFNGNLLTILAKGGRGGRGQNGGPGARGEDAVDIKDESQIDCNQLNVWTVTSVSNKNPIRCHFIYYNKTGNLGEGGGDGGHGGAGGLGGHKGNVMLFQLLNTVHASFPQISALVGDRGDPGFGGLSGEGGKHANDMKLTCDYCFTASVYRFEIIERAIPLFAKPGQSGISGISMKTRTISNTVPIVKHLPHAVNEYKVFARLHLGKEFSLQKTLESFYHLLNTQTEIIEQYDLLDIIKEFTDLEREHFSLLSHEKFKLSNLISTYIALRGRISIYEKELQNRTKDNQEYKKNILENLNYYMSKKMDNLNKNGLYFPMTHISKEFETYMQDSINKLKDQNKINFIVNELEEKTKSLSKLSEKAQSIIDNELKNAMWDIEDTLDIEIDTLLKEITDIKKKAQDNQDKLMESRNKLKNVVLLKYILGGIKIGCGLLTLINPALGLVGTIASSTLGIVETQLTSNNITVKAAEFPKAIKALTTATEKFSERDDKKKAWEDEKKIVSKLSEKASDFGKKTINNMHAFISKKLGKDISEPIGISYKRWNDDEIFQQQEAIIQNLNAKAELNDDNELKKDCTIAKTVLKYLTVANEIGQTVADSAASIAKDTSQIDEINKALMLNDENINKLKKYREQIYTDTQPMLNEMINFVDKANENMKGMSRSQLRLGRWNVINTINDVKRTLHKTLAGLNTTENIEWTVEKLVSTFEIMNDMYKEIDNYKDKHSDLEYIAKLELAHKMNKLYSDRHLTKAVAELDTAILYNSEREVYSELIFAFKQYAFPYGGNILNKTVWPYTSFTRNISNVLTDVTRNFEELEKFVSNRIIEYLEYRKRSEFMGSTSASNASFFVWKSDYLDIDRILNGFEYTFLAQISNNSKEALKFNHVELFFKSKNSTRQHELNMILKDFSVNLTHCGNSYYVSKNRLFEIKTRPTVLHFELSRDADGFPNGPSELYIKVATGAYMLSPYASWTIKLETQSSDGFERLKQFLGKIDIELIGKGQYILKYYQCDSFCEDNMLKYYHLKEQSTLF